MAKTVPSAVPSANDRPGEGHSRIVLLNEATVRGLPNGAKPNGTTYRDSEITGFACRVSPEGVKHFSLLYTRGGKSRRLHLGAHSAGQSGGGMTTLVARGEAAKERHRLDTLPDYDPAGAAAAKNRADREARRVQAAQAVVAKARAKSVAKAWEEYRADIEARVGEDALRPSTIRSIEKSFRLHVLPHLGESELQQLTPNDIAEMHRAVTKPTKPKKPRRGERAERSTGGKYAANRAVDYLSGMLSWAVENDMIPANPARKVAKKRHQEEHRERFLTDDEWSQLERLLDSWPYRELVPVGPRVKGRKMEERELDEPKLETFLSCEAIRLFLLTGCRKSEALSAEWSQFDLDAGVWTKPRTNTKQKKVHRLPIDARVVKRLRAIRSAHADPRFVFPSKGRLAAFRAGRVPKPEHGSYQQDVSGLWRRLRIELGIEDVRIHDLRHSHASALVNEGVDIIVVSKLLGHSTIRTTEKYAHVADEPLRAAVALVGKRSAAAVKPKRTRAGRG